MSSEITPNPMATDVLTCPFDFPLSKDQACIVLGISPKTLTRYSKIFDIQSDTFNESDVKNLVHLKSSLDSGMTYQSYADKYLKSSTVSPDTLSMIEELFVSRCESEFEKLLPNIPLLINRAFDNVVFKYERQIREIYQGYVNPW